MQNLKGMYESSSIGVVGWVLKLKNPQVGRGGGFAMDIFGTILTMNIVIFVGEGDSFVSHSRYNLYFC